MADRRRMSPDGSLRRENTRNDPSRRSVYDERERESQRMRPRGAVELSSSSSSSSSSSYLDISRSFPPNKTGILTFFTAPSERRRLRKRRSKKGLFRINTGNSSSSSLDGDLAYGTGFIKQSKRSVRSRKGKDIDRERYTERERDKYRDRDQYRDRGDRDRYSDRDRPGSGIGKRPGSGMGRGVTDAEILLVGAGLAKLARDQNKIDLKARGNPRRSELYGANETNFGQSGTSRGLGPSKVSHEPVPDDDGWESASDDESDSSVNSALAFDNDTNKSKWKHFFGRRKYKPKSRKSSVVDPRLFGPHNSLHSHVDGPVGFADVTWNSSTEFGQGSTFSFPSEPSGSASASQQSLTKLVPVAIDEKISYDGSSGNAGQYNPQPGYSQRRDPRHEELKDQNVSSQYGAQVAPSVIANPRYEPDRGPLITDQYSSTQARPAPPLDHYSEPSRYQEPPRYTEPNRYPEPSKYQEAGKYQEPNRYQDARDSTFSIAQPSYISSRPEPIPLQQPQPITPVSQSIFEPTYPARSESGGILKKTSSSTGRNSSIAAAALAGITAGAVIASVRDDRKDRQREEELAELEKDRLRRRESEKKDSKDDRRRDKRSSSERDDKKEKVREKDKKKYDSDERRREKKRDSRREETRDEKEERREKRREERRSERSDYDPRSSTRSEVTVVPAPINPFDFQVRDDAFPTPTVDSIEAHRRSDPVPIIPTASIVTVEREPDFTRKRNYSIKEPPAKYEPEPPRDYFPQEQDRRPRDREERDRPLHKAEEILQEVQHSTAPYDAVVISTVIAAEEVRKTRAQQRREERNSDYDEYNRTPREVVPEKKRDPIQEEADKAYREIVMARKIASEVIRQRSPSPNRSVVHKYDVDDDEEEAVKIVTPPEMADRKQKGPYDAPNADFVHDYEFQSPTEVHTFVIPELSMTRSLPPGTLPKRDPDTIQPRPILNLVRPTPTPSPAPEKQAQRSQPSRRRSKSVDRENPKPESNSETDSRTVVEESQPKYTASDVVIGPRGNVIISPTTSTVSKGVTWGENETKHYEVESPSDHREEFISHSEVRTREVPEEIQQGPNSKTRGWGALAGSIIGMGAIGAVAAAAADESSALSQSKGEDRKSASAYEYRGVVVEPDSPPRSRRTSVSVDQRQPSPPAPGPKPTISQTTHMPGAFDDDIEFTAAVAAGLEDTGFNPDIVIDDPAFRRRDSPPGSNEHPLYRAPFAETVTDLGTISSNPPGAQGFVIGEVASTPQEWRSVSPPKEEEVPMKLSKKEQKKLDKARRQSGDVTPAEETPVTREIVEEPESYFVEPKLSKKDQKKLDKSRRQSGDVTPLVETPIVETPALREIEVVEEPESYFVEPKLSKKEQKKRDKEAQRQRSLNDDVSPPAELSLMEQIVVEPEPYFETPKKSKKSKNGFSSFEETPDESSRVSRSVSVPVDVYADLANDKDDWATETKKSKKSKRESDRYDSPARSVPSSEVGIEERSSSRKSKRDSSRYDSPARSEVASEVGSSKRDKSKRRSESYDVDPTEVSLPPSTPSEASEYDDSRRSRKSSGRDSGIFSSADRGESRSVVSAGASRYDDDEPRKSKKKSRSGTKDDYDDTRSVASAPAGDDWEDSKKSKKKDKKDDKKDEKRSSGFFGFFGSKSESGARDESPKNAKDDTEDVKKKKKKRSSTADSSSLYSGIGATSVNDLSRSSSVSNGKTNGNGSHHDYDKYEDGTRSDGEREKKKSRSRSASTSSKKDSFLGSTGTLGAGAGVAGAAVAIAAQQYLQTKAANTNDSEKTEDTRSMSLDQLLEREEALDPDIPHRVFRPSIDPQYGDLLPLPPSGPTSPHVEPVDELPGLPDSRPGTPEADRIARERAMSAISTFRKNQQETPTKSPSQSAVPVRFFLGNRSTPPSPVPVRASPMQSPAAPNQEPLSFPKFKSRPTSWEGSKEFRPLYLVESHRRGSNAQLAEAEEAALPPSQVTSRSSSQNDFGNRDLDEPSYDSVDPLYIDTDLVRSSSPAQLLGSEQSTPKALFHDKDIGHGADTAETPKGEHFDYELPSQTRQRSPSPPAQKSGVSAENIIAGVAVAGLAAAAGGLISDLVNKKDDIDNDSTFTENRPSPVDVVSKDRSSYLLKSSPVPSKFDDFSTDSPIHTPNFSSNREVLHSIDERDNVADTMTEEEISREREKALESLSGGPTPQKEPTEDLTTAGITEAEPIDEFAFTTPKKSKKDKKKNKGLSRSLTQDDLPTLTESSTTPQPEASTVIEQAPVEETPTKTKSDKKKAKKKSKSFSAWDEPEETQQPVETTLDSAFEPLPVPPSLFPDRTNISEEPSISQPDRNLEDKSALVPEVIPEPQTEEELDEFHDALDEKIHTPEVAQKPEESLPAEEGFAPVSKKDKKDKKKDKKKSKTISLEPEIVIADEILEGTTVSPEDVFEDAQAGVDEPLEASLPSNPKKSKKDKKKGKSTASWEETEPEEAEATLQTTRDIVHDVPPVITQPIEEEVSVSKSSKKDKKKRKSQVTFELDEPVIPEPAQETVEDVQVVVNEPIADFSVPLKSSKKDKKKRKSESSPDPVMPPITDSTVTEQSKDGLKDDIPEQPVEDEFPMPKLSNKDKKKRKSQNTFNEQDTLPVDDPVVLESSKEIFEEPTSIDQDVIDNHSLGEVALDGSELKKENIAPTDVPLQSSDLEKSGLIPESSISAENLVTQERSIEETTHVPETSALPEESVSEVIASIEQHPSSVNEATISEGMETSEKSQITVSEPDVPVVEAQDYASHVEETTPDPDSLEAFSSSKKKKKKPKKAQTIDDGDKLLATTPTDTESRELKSEDMIPEPEISSSNPTPTGGPGAWPMTPATPQTGGEVQEATSKGYFATAASLLPAAAAGAALLMTKPFRKDSPRMDASIPPVTESKALEADAPLVLANIPEPEASAPDGLKAGYKDEQLSLARQLQEEFASGSKKSSKKDKKKRQSLPSTPDRLPSRSRAVDDIMEDHHRARSLSIEPSAEGSSGSPANPERVNIYSEEQLELARQMKEEFAAKKSKKEKKGRKGRTLTQEDDFSSPNFDEAQGSGAGTPQIDVSEAVSKGDGFAAGYQEDQLSLARQLQAEFGSGSSSKKSKKDKKRRSTSQTPLEQDRTDDYFGEQFQSLEPAQLEDPPVSPGSQVQQVTPVRDGLAVGYNEDQLELARQMQEEFAAKKSKKDKKDKKRQSLLRTTTEDNFSDTKDIEDPSLVDAPAVEHTDEPNTLPEAEEEFPASEKKSKKEKKGKKRGNLLRGTTDESLGLEGAPADIEIPLNEDSPQGLVEEVPSEPASIEQRDDFVTSKKSKKDRKGKNRVTEVETLVPDAAPAQTENDDNAQADDTLQAREIIPDIEEEFAPIKKSKKDKKGKKRADADEIPVLDAENDAQAEIVDVQPEILPEILPEIENDFAPTKKSKKDKNKKKRESPMPTDTEDLPTPELDPTLTNDANTTSDVVDTTQDVAPVEIEEDFGSVKKSKKEKKGKKKDSLMRANLEEVPILDSESTPPTEEVVESSEPKPTIDVEDDFAPTKKSKKEKKGKKKDTFVEPDFEELPVPDSEPALPVDETINPLDDAPDSVPTLNTEDFAPIKKLKKDKKNKKSNIVNQEYVDEASNAEPAAPSSENDPIQPDIVTNNQELLPIEIEDDFSPAKISKKEKKGKKRDSAIVDKDGAEPSTIIIDEPQTVTENSEELPAPTQSSTQEETALTTEPQEDNLPAVVVDDIPTQTLEEDSFTSGKKSKKDKKKKRETTTFDPSSDLAKSESFQEVSEPTSVDFVPPTPPAGPTEEDIDFPVKKSKKDKKKRQSLLAQEDVAPQPEIEEIPTETILPSESPSTESPAPTLATEAIPDTLDDFTPKKSKKDKKKKKQDLLSSVDDDLPAPETAAEEKPLESETQGQDLVLAPYPEEEPDTVEFSAKKSKKDKKKSKKSSVGLESSFEPEPALETIIAQPVSEESANPDDLFGDYNLSKGSKKDKKKRKNSIKTDSAEASGYSTPLDPLSEAVEIVLPSEDISEQAIVPKNLDPVLETDTLQDQISTPAEDEWDSLSRKNAKKSKGKGKRPSKVELEEPSETSTPLEPVSEQIVPTFSTQPTAIEQPVEQAIDNTIISGRREPADEPLDEWAATKKSKKDKKKRKGSSKFDVDDPIPESAELTPLPEPTTPFSDEPAPIERSLNTEPDLQVDPVLEEPAIDKPSDTLTPEKSEKAEDLEIISEKVVIDDASSTSFESIQQPPEAIIPSLSTESTALGQSQSFVNEPEDTPAAQEVVDEPLEEWASTKKSKKDKKKRKGSSKFGLDEPTPEPMEALVSEPLSIDKGKTKVDSQAEQAKEIDGPVPVTLEDIPEELPEQPSLSRKNSKKSKKSKKSSGKEEFDEPTDVPIQPEPQSETAQEVTTEPATTEEPTVHEVLSQPLQEDLDVAKDNVVENPVEETFEEWAPSKKSKKDKKKGKSTRSPSLEEPSEASVAQTSMEQTLDEATHATLPTEDVAEKEILEFTPESNAISPPIEEPAFEPFEEVAPTKKSKKDKKKGKSSVVLDQEISSVAPTQLEPIAEPLEEAVHTFLPGEDSIQRDILDHTAVTTVTDSFMEDLDEGKTEDLTPAKKSKKDKKKKKGMATWDEDIPTVADASQPVADVIDAQLLSDEPTETHDIDKNLEDTIPQEVISVEPSNDPSEEWAPTPKKSKKDKKKKKDLATWDEELPAVVDAPQSIAEVIDTQIPSDAITEIHDSNKTLDDTISQEVISVEPANETPEEWAPTPKKSKKDKKKKKDSAIVDFEESPVPVTPLEESSDKKDTISPSAEPDSIAEEQPIQLPSEQDFTPQDTQQEHVQESVDEWAGTSSKKSGKAKKNRKPGISTPVEAIAAATALAGVAAIAASSLGNESSNQDTTLEGEDKAIAVEPEDEWGSASTKKSKKDKKKRKSGLSTPFEEDIELPKSTVDEIDQSSSEIQGTTDVQQETPIQDIHSVEPSVESESIEPAEDWAAIPVKKSKKDKKKKSGLSTPKEEFVPEPEPSQLEQLAPSDSSRDISIEQPQSSLDPVSLDLPSLTSVQDNAENTGDDWGSVSVKKSKKDKKRKPGLTNTKEELVPEPEPSELKQLTDSKDVNLEQSQSIAEPTIVEPPMLTAGQHDTENAEDEWGSVSVKKSKKDKKRKPEKATKIEEVTPEVEQISSEAAFILSTTDVLSEEVKHVTEPVTSEGATETATEQVDNGAEDEWGAASTKKSKKDKKKRKADISTPVEPSQEPENLPVAEKDASVNPPDPLQDPIGQEPASREPSDEFSGTFESKKSKKDKKKRKPEISTPVEPIEELEILPLEDKHVSSSAEPSVNPDEVLKDSIDQELLSNEPNDESAGVFESKKSKKDKKKGRSGLSTPLEESAPTEREISSLVDTIKTIPHPGPIDLFHATTSSSTAFENEPQARDQVAVEVDVSEEKRPDPMVQGTQFSDSPFMEAKDEDAPEDPLAFVTKRSKKEKKGKRASKFDSESEPSTSIPIPLSPPAENTKSASAKPEHPIAIPYVEEPREIEPELQSAASKIVDIQDTDKATIVQEEPEVFTISRKGAKKDKRKRQPTIDASTNESGSSKPPVTSWADDVEEAEVERDLPVIEEIAKDESLSHIPIMSPSTDDFVRPSKKGKKSNQRKGSLTEPSATSSIPIVTATGVAAITAALLSKAEKSTPTDIQTPTRKMSKKEKKKMSIDKRAPKEDIFDDPALWEGADPMVFEETKENNDDAGSDGFWSPPQEQVDEPISQEFGEPPVNISRETILAGTHTEPNRGLSPPATPEPRVPIAAPQIVEPPRVEDTQTSQPRLESSSPNPRSLSPSNNTPDFLISSSKTSKDKKKPKNASSRVSDKPASDHQTIPITSSEAIAEPHESMGFSINKSISLDHEPPLNREYITSPQSHQEQQEHFQRRALSPEYERNSPTSSRISTPRSSRPRLSDLPVVLEENLNQVEVAHNPQHHDHVAEEPNRDSAFSTDSPIIHQRGFADHHEHARDSGVHLRDDSPATRIRAPVFTADDALARLSWPPVDEETETVDLHRPQRSKAAISKKHAHEVEQTPEAHDSKRSKNDKVTDLHRAQRLVEDPKPFERVEKTLNNRDLLPSQTKEESLTDVHRTPTVHGRKVGESSLVKQRLQRFESPDLPKPNFSKTESPIPEIRKLDLRKDDLQRSQSPKLDSTQTPKLDKYRELNASPIPRAEKLQGFSDLQTAGIVAGAAITGASLGFAAARKISLEKRPDSAQSMKSSPNINRLRTPDIKRPDSVGSNRSATPPLRRTSRQISGDLRSLSQRSKTDLAKEAELAAVTDTAINTANPTANEGRARAKDMADVYDGFGEGRMGSPRSPTRPHSMRRRQSMQVLDLESKVEQLAAENRMLAEAKAQAERTLMSSQHASSSLVEKDSEIDSLKRTLDWLQNEVQRLTEVNEGLTSANVVIARQHSDRYGMLENEHAEVSRELQETRDAHENLSAGMEGIVKNQVQTAVAEKDRVIAQLRAELDTAKEKIREMQRQILAAKANDLDFLTIRDEDYFDNACQQLCQHVQQWVLRFSKFSDMRACRLTSEINNDKTIDRLDNAILDGSDVDSYLADRVKRRDVFMSMTMTMVWEFVFTRYLFGMDREQRQKLKSLEKTLSEVGPPSAVHMWRATTLTLLARRKAFAQQREQDTQAVVHAILETLSEILPPPSQLETQIEDQLMRVMKSAVDLSIEMRTQRAEYMMLPPLQPEYDANGDLASKVSFNSALMNERSGDTVSNEDLETQKAVVRIVLFPLVVKKGDDEGNGDEEIVVCPAQVLVAKAKKARFMDGNNHSRVSMQSSMPAGDDSVI